MCLLVQKSFDLIPFIPTTTPTTAMKTKMTLRAAMTRAGTPSSWRLTPPSRKTSEQLTTSLQAVQLSTLLLQLV